MSGDMQTKQTLGKKKAVKRLDVVRNILEEKGLNPFEGLIEICQERNSDDTDYRYGVEVRVPCLKELASYVAPKLRSMELTAEGGGASLGFQIIQFGEIANGNSPRNNPQHSESGEHGLLRESVHVHSSDDSSSSSDEEANHSDSGSNGGIESKGLGF
tara:strand:- start:637 stop:1110 length:474 start_codon:yes stop_codon:yes gene_type:complete